MFVCESSRVCSCLRTMHFATEGPWIQPEASLLFLSSLIDWTDWWSAPWSSQERKYWPPPWNPTTRDWTGVECVYMRERERCRLKVIILVESPESASTSSVCVAKISLCVCVFMAFCLRDSRVSVNQSTLILYTSGLDGCPRLFVDTVYSCFPSADSSHPPLPEQTAQPCLPQPWAAFKGSKINHRNVW